VEVVDSDLGSSAGIGAKEREGFKQVIGQVALGEVGAVFSREASRLARTDKDWCQLLEVCQLFETLIVDDEQVYDLDLMDDQLVLGIKGTLSVVELKVLRMRMLQGRREKARRGELRMKLPTGYVYDADGKVVKTPDQRMQQALELVFRRFRQLWSIRQTFMWFVGHEMELPVVMHDRRTVVWKKPTMSFINHLIHNPFYAGAYSFGRRPVETVLQDGKLVKRSSTPRRPEEYTVLIRDHHEGYIDWATFEDNQRMVRQNTWTTDDAVQAVRSGQGLLVGLIRCGHCGRKLHVRYWGKSGTNARYFCDGDYAEGGSYCVSFAGRQVDARLGEELLAVLSPLGVDASVQALEELESGRADERSLLGQKVRQLEYEGQRAREQYDEVDPRNRLVAFELERRWNDKLEELKTAKEYLEAFDSSALQLTETDRDRLRQLGERFGEVWASAACPMKLRKQIVRTVVEELVVTHDEATNRLRFVAHWKGGAHTAFELDKPRPWKGPATPAPVLDILQAMAPRYSDQQIASVLSRHGHRTVRGLRWTAPRVQAARIRHGIPGGRRGTLEADTITRQEAARYAGVAVQTLDRLRDRGVLKMTQAVPYAPWEIQRGDLDSEPVRSMLEHLRATGRLPSEGGDATAQRGLFEENQEGDHARHSD